MWVVALGAVLAIGVALATGALQLRRDSFFLLFYLQSVAYLNIAPTLAAPDVNVALQERYVWIQSWAFVLFQLPLLLLYCTLIRRRARHAAATRSFVFSRWRLQLFIGGAMVLGVGYFVVAARYGVVYRRIGGEELAAAQLRMSLPELAVYRTFLELGTFISAALLLVLRLPSNISPAFQRIARVGFAGATFLWLAYAATNSRLSAAMTIAMLYAVMNVTARTGRKFDPQLVMGAVLVVVGVVYTMQVVSNIRLSYSTGGGLFALENFLPIGSQGGQLDDTLRWRMNGIDLIAIIAENVETQGAAHGGAWAVPFVLSLDPIVRTPFTLAAKAAALTSAKSWLLLRYGGVSKTDYYSCMLSDAYGNFSIYGFLFAAAVSAFVLAIATGALSWSGSPAAICLGLFALTRILPFEQEFSTLLFGWLKLIPFVLLGVAFYPLRRNRQPAPAVVAP